MNEIVHIDGFEIRREIASGGFATVYEAIQLDLDRPVAIKVLHPGVLSESQRSLFEQECRVWGNLSQQPGIVTVHQVAATSSGMPCLVMQLCDGTLRDRPGLDLQNVVEVGVQAAEALQRIHDYRIVHRDIKPHNIFVDFDRRTVSIGDFGISAIVDERTLTGGAALSVDYAAPEAFSTGGSGQSGDIYSLGATLYYLIAGEVPFPVAAEGRERFAAAGMRIIQDPPPHLPLTSPESLDRLLQATMAKAPDERPATARRLAEQLRFIQQEIGVPTRPLPAFESGSSPPPDRPAPVLDLGGAGSKPGPSVAVPIEGTIVRPGSRKVDPGRGPGVDGTPAGAIDRPDDAAPGDRGGGHRGLAIIGLVVSVVAVLGFVAWLAGGGTEGTASEAGVDTSSTTLDSAASAEFVILVPPTDVVVSAAGDGGFEFTWETDDGFRYQIELLGSDQTTLVDAVPFVWDVPIVGEGSACFQVRTLDQSGSRMSQAASTPTCAG